MNESFGNFLKNLGQTTLMDTIAFSVSYHRYLIIIDCSSLSICSRSTLSSTSLLPQPHELLQAEKIIMVVVMHISPPAPGRGSEICKGNTIKTHHWTLLLYKSLLLFSSSTAALVEYPENH